MALFRCKRSGTVVEFTEQHVVDAMMEHHEYDFVDTSVIVEVVKEDGTRRTITLKKPMGRPRKERI